MRDLTFMPESGKKADLMFVQHMISVLKSDGKLAVIMPHGVLFRGGEEKNCRKKIIDAGILEAVIGLPPQLFYGTGIPACVLVINKQGAKNRKSILFINADREFKEGKNQNSLRPEDIEKITHVYRNHLTVEKYSREVPVSEIAAEDYNLNIRRYVDNSPPPEPHDVRAHLHGGVPVAEIDALQPYFENYVGIREKLFKPRKDDPKYADFADAITSKNSINAIIDAAPCVQAKYEAFHAALDKWWKKNVHKIEALPETQNVFDLRREFIDSIAKALVPQGILNLHQVRGAFAAYMTALASDFKSVAASGWTAELIPEEEILQSQFPEVLEQLEKDEARIAELEAMFAAVEDEDAEETEDGVLPDEVAKALKAEAKDLKGQAKELARQLKAMGKDAKMMDRAAISYPSEDRAAHRAKVAEVQKQIDRINGQIEEIEKKLHWHAELEEELRQLRANVREAERKKDEMVAAAREKITTAEAHAAGHRADLHRVHGGGQHASEGRLPLPAVPCRLQDHRPAAEGADAEGPLGRHLAHTGIGQVAHDGVRRPQAADVR